MRVLQYIQRGLLPQRFRKLRIADITIRIFAQRFSIFVQYGNAGKPEGLRFCPEAFGVVEIQGVVFSQLPHRHRHPAQRFCGDGIVIFFVAGGLHLYKVDGAVKVFLGSAHGLLPGEEGHCQQKQHPHQQVERRHPHPGGERFLVTVQGRPPPDTFPGPADTCLRSASVCHRRAWRQGSRSAFRPARGCRSAQRLRRCR